MNELQKRILRLGWIIRLYERALRDEAEARACIECEFDMTLAREAELDQALLRTVRIRKWLP